MPLDSRLRFGPQIGRPTLPHGRALKFESMLTNNSGNIPPGWQNGPHQYDRIRC